MIRKCKGINKISHLRVIHIYEANYNLLLKMFWPNKVTHRAEDFNLLNKNQLGTNPKRNFETITIMNELIIESCASLDNLCVSPKTTPPLVIIISFLISLHYTTRSTQYQNDSATFKHIPWSIKHIMRRPL